MRAADALWRTKGFAQTTVSEICEAAGVAKGTFYFYFPHKEDLLLELGFATAERAAGELPPEGEVDEAVTTGDLVRRMLEAVARRVERTPPTLVQATIVEIYRAVDRFPQVREGRSDFRTTFTNILRRGQVRGEIDKELDPGDVASMLTSVVMQGMLIWTQSAASGRRLVDILWTRASVVLRGAAPLAA